MNTLDYEQDLIEKLGELGSQLRQVREQKQMSLEQVSAKTMIQPRLLKAIEAGKLEQLPEPIYTHGFIRRFAEALDLNGAEFASAFPARARVQPRSHSWTQLPAPQLRTFHLYLLYVVLIIAAASGLSYLLNRSTVGTSTTPVPSLQPGTASRPAGAGSQAAKPPNKAAAVNGLNNTSAPVQTAKSPAIAQTVQVDVTIKQESWLEIVADGKTEFEGILPPETQRTWTAKQQLVIRAGNAGGVFVTADKTPAQPLGQPGAVETKTFESTSSPTGSPQPATPASPQVPGNAAGG